MKLNAKNTKDKSTYNKGRYNKGKYNSCTYNSQWTKSTTDPTAFKNLLRLRIYPTAFKKVI